MEKGFWVPKRDGQMTDGDIVFGNTSRIEHKRSNQWLSDTAGPDFFLNKRQALETPICKPESVITITNALPWDNSSEFETMPTGPNLFMDRLFGSEISRPVNLTERTMTVNADGSNTRKEIATVNADGSNTRKEIANKRFENDPSVGLSISYAMENSETDLSYSGMEKVDVDQVKEPENGLHIYAEHNIGLSMDQAYSRGSENTFTSMGQPYGKESESATLTSQFYDIGNMNIKPVCSTFEKCVDNTIPTTSSYRKQDSHNACFGGYQNESIIDILSRPISSYSLLYEQSVIHPSEMPGNTKLDLSNGNAVMNNSQPPKSSMPKNKLETRPARNEPPNSFPSNVRSLLATGILDAVPVRYVSTSREELHGVIKGSGYLCGCHSCNNSKVLNAYEFERHAGSKTKHPNNHIYFENGKTIYQTVQELKSTPESMLFDAVLTITGSPINQKAFRSWKESFQAATRELQRIYGKEELSK